DPEVIRRLNRNFVCTSIIIDDVQKRAETGDELAKQLTTQWEYPLELIFLTPDCRLVSRLNSFKDFPGVHPDVVAPPQTRHVGRDQEQSHSGIFLKHLASHFGGG